MSEPTFEQLMDLANRARRAQEAVDAMTTIGEQQFMHGLVANTNRIANALEGILAYQRRQEVLATPAINLLKEISTDEDLPMHLRADADQVLGEVYGVRE